MGRAEGKAMESAGERADGQPQPPPPPPLTRVGDSIEDLPYERMCVQHKARQAKVRAAAEFGADLRKMIDNPEFGDVVFRCCDGAPVHACRLFLVARSTVLNRMLMNGMVESRLSEIALPEVSSAALHAVLEFLYTGKLVERAPESWQRALEIFEAARFFLLADLELVVLENLLERTAQADSESDMVAAARLLSVAVEFQAVRESPSADVVLRDLVGILDSRCQETAHLRALSDKAFLFFLEKTRNEHGDVGTLSFDEYRRLWHVVLWCACHLWQDDAEGDEAVRALLPDMKTSLAMLKTPDDAWARGLWQQQLGGGGFAERKEELAMMVADFVDTVDLRRIHPELLVYVVEPMGIVAPALMLDALRFHALQRWRGGKAQTKVHEWHFRGSKADIYSVWRDGSVIEHVAPGLGFVRYSACIGRPYGVFEWDIVIEKVCDEFCEVGLYQSTLSHSDGSSLAEQPGGWALRMDEAGIFVNRRGRHCIRMGDPGFVPYGTESGKDFAGSVYGKDYGHKNTRIGVRLDMFERTCSFSVDRESLGAAWTNLPEGNYYPAATLGSGRRGRARIHLIAGFDIL